MGDLDIGVFMVMESVKLRLSLRLLLTLGIWEDMATLDLDMDILDLDTLVFMEAIVAFMVMESVRLRLNLRLLLTLGIWEDLATLHLDMEVMEVLDILVFMVVIMVGDMFAKKHFKS